MLLLNIVAGTPGSPPKLDVDRESFISKAVKILEKDTGLSDETRLEAAEIFMQQPLVAEGFVAMGEGTRRAWLKKNANGP